jgi:ATP-dependent Clp protease ATP-binding subunit ClpB
VHLQAYEPAYGARPLRRWLEHTIITDLSRMIIGGQLPDNSNVTADADPMAGPLTYSVEAKPLPEGVAANGGFVGQLKRQLEPFGSQALEEDDDDYMKA